MPNVSSFGAQTDNAVVSGTVTDRQMIIPEVPPQGLMSVGPRVTPNFVKPREWNAQTTYHFFDAVRDAAGNAYIATKPVVPAGTPLTNEDYWFLWADPDTRFDDLNETVKTFNQRITQNTNDIATKAPINHASEETIYGIGNEVNYGHVKLAADDTPVTSGANDGVAATPSYVNNTYNTNMKTPELFGAVGDGITDDTEAFKQLFASCKCITLTPGKTYLLDNLKISYIGEYTINGNGATIKTKETFAINLDTQWPSTTYNIINFNSVIFDGAGNGCVQVENFAARTHFNNCTFKNFTTYGFYNARKGAGFEYYFVNCWFANNDYVAGTAIHLNTSDSLIDSCVIQNALTGIFSRGLNTITKNHFWISGSLSRKNSVAIVLGYNEKVIDNYIDSIETSFLITQDASSPKFLMSGNNLLTTNTESDVTFYLIENKSSTFGAYVIDGLCVTGTGTAKFSKEKNFRASLSHCIVPDDFFADFVTMDNMKLTRATFAGNNSILEYELTLTDAIEVNNVVFNLPNLIVDSCIAYISNQTTDVRLNQYTSGFYTSKRIETGKYNIKIIF